MMITLEKNKEVVDNIEFIESADDIVEGCRLFYELVNGTRPTGYFKEIDDPVSFKEKDKRFRELGMNNIDVETYRNHHRFCVKK
jgi:hypothetical protein